MARPSINWPPTDAIRKEAIEQRRDTIRDKVNLVVEYKVKLSASSVCPPNQRDYEPDKQRNDEHPADPADQSHRTDHPTHPTHHPAARSQSDYEQYGYRRYNRQQYCQSLFGHCSLPPSCGNSLRPLDARAMSGFARSFHAARFLILSSHDDLAFDHVHRAGETELARFVRRELNCDRLVHWKLALYVERGNQHFRRASDFHLPHESYSRRNSSLEIYRIGLKTFFAQRHFH